MQSDSSACLSRLLYERVKRIVGLSVAKLLRMFVFLRLTLSIPTGTCTLTGTSNAGCMKQEALLLQRGRAMLCAYL